MAEIKLAPGDKIRKADGTRFEVAEDDATVDANEIEQKKHYGNRWQSLICPDPKCQVEQAAMNRGRILTAIRGNSALDAPRFRTVWPDETVRPICGFCQTHRLVWRDSHKDNEN